jgi:DNA-nicking Smr family endonuclease
MTRSLRPEDARLWALVTATVRPAHGRGPSAAAKPSTASPAPAPEPENVQTKPPPRFPGRLKPRGPAPEAKAPSPPPPAAPSPSRIEPNRQRRIARGRDPLDRRLDLHGFDQDRAHAALRAFLHRAQADGVRAVLVITGKGLQGDGVLRRRAPEWLAEPGLRGVVAGVSPADRRHGGEGALYVALKRRG